MSCLQEKSVPMRFPQGPQGHPGQVKLLPSGFLGGFVGGGTGG
jgi:hypothetical protein